MIKLVYVYLFVTLIHCPCCMLVLLVLLLRFFFLRVMVTVYLVCDMMIKIEEEKRREDITCVLCVLWVSRSRSNRINRGIDEEKKEREREKRKKRERDKKHCICLLSFLEKRGEERDRIYDPRWIFIWNIEMKKVMRAREK